MINIVVFLFLINCFVNSNLIIGNDFFSNKINNALKLNKISDSPCIKELNKYVSDIKLKKKWALYMADATSKIPSGFFIGSMVDMGSFDQCLDIEESITIEEKTRTVHGKYCQVEFPLKKVLFDNITNDFDITLLTQFEVEYVAQLVLSHASLTLSLCVPNSCAEKELKTLLQLDPELEYSELQVTNCQTKNDNKDLNTSDIIFILFFLLILTIMGLSTFYDLRMHKENKKPCHEILIAFSVYTNGKKLFSTETNTNHLQCINGVRFLSTVWIIYVHAHFGYFYTPLINSVGAIKGLGSLPMMLFNNGTLPVDTFFLLAGLVMINSFLKDHEKGKKFSIFRHYVHRYLRLAPPLAMVIFFYTTLLRFMTSGPYWPTVSGSAQENCKTYWWAALLFIQNYVNPLYLCIEQTWYLSADMQLFIISPLIFYFIVKNQKKTIIGLGILVLISIIIAFSIAFVFELHGLPTIATFIYRYYMQHYYMNTPARCGPWFVGIILGYYIFNRQKNVTFNKMLKNKTVVNTGWIVSLGTLFCIVFVSILLFLPYNQIVHSLFTALHRVVWSIAVGWIIYVCVVNETGLINNFLSHPYFQILSRLSYCMYITHFIFMFMLYGQNNQPVKWNLLNIIHNFAGNFLLTIIVSIFWTLAFESPIAVIEKIIFKEGPVLSKEELSEYSHKPEEHHDAVSKKIK